MILAIVICVIVSGMWLLSNNCPTWEHFVFRQTKGDLGLCYQEDMNRQSTVWWHGHIYTSDRGQAATSSLSPMVPPKGRVNRFQIIYNSALMYYSEGEPHTVLIGDGLTPWDMNVRITNCIFQHLFCIFVVVPPSSQLGYRKKLFPPLYTQLVDLTRKLNFLTSQSSA